MSASLERALALPRGTAFAIFAVGRSAPRAAAGAGALLVYVRSQWFDRDDAQTLLARFCAGFAVLSASLPFVAGRLGGELERAVFTALRALQAAA